MTTLRGVRMEGKTTQLCRMTLAMPDQAEVMNLLGILIGIPMEHLVNPAGMMIIGGIMISELMIMTGAILELLGQIGNQGLTLTIILQSVMTHLIDHMVIGEMLTAGMGGILLRESRGLGIRKNMGPRHDGTGYDKDADLRKETNSTRRHPEEKESKNKEKFKQEEALKKRSGKEIEKSSCAAEPELETREKRRSLFSSVGPGVENAQHMEMDTSGGIKDETMNDLNAAKIAAMKAAESVKKNILGFGAGTGRLSTDQKKKLLWGNKKSNPPETSTHWDSNLFLTGSDKRNSTSSWV